MSSFFVRKADLNKIKSILKCVYCGSKEKLVIDHIIPRNKGGSNELSNLTRACNRCNLYKSDFTINVFLDRIKTKREKARMEYWKWSNRFYNQIKRHKVINYKMLENLKKARKDHSYYSAIIGNIIRNKYKSF